MKHLLTIIMVSTIGFLSSTASACDVAPPPYETVFDDSPECLVVDTNMGPVRLTNLCETRLEITVSALIERQMAEDYSMEFFPQEDSDLQIAWDGSEIQWTLDDGRSGRIEIRSIPREDDPCSAFGCDTTAMDTPSAPTWIGILIIGALGFQRRRRLRA